MKKRWIVIAPLGVLTMLLFIALGGEIVLQLWNWLLPQIFGWRRITFWQAVGILALCRVLFGGFGLHRPARSNARRLIAERAAEHMTPEERERFYQAMRGRFGFGPSASESKG